MNPEIGYVRVTNARVDMAPDSQPEEDEVVVRVDRSNPVLGNKHILFNKLDRAERAGVIGMFQQDLEADFAANGPMRAAVEDLARRVIAGEKICLQCHCRPLPCHAEIIERKVNEVVSKLMEQSC